MVYIKKSENFPSLAVNKKMDISSKKKEEPLAFLIPEKNKIEEKNKTEGTSFFSWFKKKQANKKNKSKNINKVEKIKNNKSQEKTSELKKKKRKRIFLFLIPQDEKEYFIENLSMLFSSGMNVLLALDSIRKEVKSSQMKAVIDRMREDIEAGTPMWQILSETRFFPSFVISLIKIGEHSGSLGKNLKVISVQQKKDRAFTSKIRSAMMYPGFVLGLTLIVGIGIAWFILPRLTLVFDQLKINLPLITRVLIAFGKFIAHYGSVVVPAFIVIIFLLFFFVFVFSRTKFIGQFLLFSIPGIKKLVQETELARMGYIMGTLLQAGLPIRSAMESLIESSSFYKYKNFYKHLKTSIEEGDTFQQSFDNFKKSGKLVPATVQQMIVIGENSGQLPETFFVIGENFEEKIDNTTKNLSVILEPILLVIVWLGVVAVALAVILPIYSLIGGLNNSNNSSPNTSSVTPPPAIETISDPDQLVEISPMQDVATSKEKKLEIKKTSIGFLNVRDQNNIKGKIIAKANVGEQYVFRNEQNGWYEIILSDGITGWVKSDYVSILGL